MRRGRGTVTAVLAVAVVLPAAACAADAGASGAVAAAPAVAAVQTEASCLVPDVLRALALDPGPTAAPSAAPAGRGVPPDGFAADTVLVCGRGQPLRDSAGVWHSVTSTRLEGDLTEVLRLVAPVRTSGTCADGPAPQVWLVDALDAGVLLPADIACDGAGDALAAALGELDVVRTTEEPVDLAVPAPDTSQGPGAPGARTLAP